MIQRGWNYRIHAMSLEICFIQRSLSTVKHRGATCVMRHELNWIGLDSM